MTQTLGQLIRKWTERELPGTVRQGIYHYRREAAGNITRFHLRVEQDGSGLLLANSSIAARLSASGVVIAKALLEGQTDSQIRRIVRARFRGVQERQFISDLTKLQRFIETLSNPEDNYPIFNLDDPAVSTPHGLLAPFHAQLPVMAGEQAKPLLQSLWANGIVHATFSAVASSMPEDAVHNIERAEDLGMISGLRATGTWLQQPDLIQKLAMAGMDYAIVPFVSPDSALHDSFLGAADHAKALQCIEDCRKWELCPVAEIPILRENKDQIEPLLTFLEERGVRNVQYFAVAGEGGLDETEVIQAAIDVESLSHHSLVRYVWLAPESGITDLRSLLNEGPRCTGDVSIRVEADGSVYPPRGKLESAGNLLTQDWQQIWNHDAFRRYRERVETPTHCDLCPGLAICAADCPGDPRGWAGR